MRHGGNRGDNDLHLKMKICSRKITKQLLVNEEKLQGWREGERGEET